MSYLDVYFLNDFSSNFIILTKNVEEKVDFFLQIKNNEDLRKKGIILDRWQFKEATRTASFIFENKEKQKKNIQIIYCDSIDILLKINNMSDKPKIEVIYA